MIFLRITTATEYQSVLNLGLCMCHNFQSDGPTYHRSSSTRILAFRGQPLTWQATVVVWRFIVAIVQLQDTDRCLIGI